MSGFNACVHLLDSNIAAGRGAKTAFSDPTRALTYSELQTQTHACANMLAGLGVRREERVALAMLDTVDWPVVFLGAIRAGIVPVALNTLLASDQYAYMLNDSRARVLFVSQALLSVLAPAIARADSLAHVIVVDAPAGDAQGFKDSGHKDFAALMAAASRTPVSVNTHADETAFWLYSSGSTGAPKGARHRHTSLSETARLFGHGVLGITEQDVVYSAAKFFFAYGLGNSLSFPMSVGASVVIDPGRPTPQTVFGILEKHQPTIFCGVPTLFAAMLNDSGLASHAGSKKLRVSTSAGEALPEHLGTRWCARFGSDILDGVGSTEMLHIFLANAPGDIVYGTSGRAVPGYALRLLDDAGADVAAGDIGELYVSGPSAADSYWNQHAKSVATFQGPWTRTGDRYTRDDTHRYTYCGRADDMFKVSGIWVSPFEVEAALASHPAVLEAAIVPAQDVDGLLKPKAFVVLADAATQDPNLIVVLQEHVKSSIGLWKYPRWIEIVETLPKTATGKIQRFRLRDTQ